MILELSVNEKVTTLIQEEVNTIDSVLYTLLQGDNLFKEDKMFFEGFLDKFPILNVVYGKDFIPALDIEEGFSVFFLEKSGGIRCLSSDSEIGDLLISLKGYYVKEYLDFIAEMSTKFPKEIFIVVIDTEDEMLVEYLRGKRNIKVYGIKE